MTTSSYEKILQMETTPEALEATVNYLARLMKPFLQTLEPVLICFPDEGPASIGGVFKEAVLRCDAMPVLWKQDFRWLDLLRVAFDTHANTLIGHPSVVLGLMKLAKATGTPLYFYDVIMAGDPFPRWIVNGLKLGMDCNAWGCYAVRTGPVIAGFSCTQEAGIHIRQDVFRPYLQDCGDKKFGMNRGRLMFSYAKDPELIYDPEQISILQYQPCSCGCDEVRVVENEAIRNDELSRNVLEERLLTWTSVLDYRVEYTDSGASLELVVFPNEKIPKIPSFAKLNVRYWNPQDDVPFCMQKNTGKSQ